MEVNQIDTTMSTVTLTVKKINQKPVWDVMSEAGLAFTAKCNKTLQKTKNKTKKKLKNWSHQAGLDVPRWIQWVKLVNYTKLQEKCEWWTILGCEQTATVDELKKAYHKRSKKLHPDKCKSHPAAVETFKILGNAFEKAKADLWQRAMSRMAQANMSDIKEKQARKGFGILLKAFKKSARCEGSPQWWLRVLRECAPEGWECPMCLNNFQYDEMQKLCCGHIICEECIEDLRVNKDSNTGLVQCARCNQKKLTKMPKFKVPVEPGAWKPEGATRNARGATRKNNPNWKTLPTYIKSKPKDWDHKIVYLEYKGGITNEVNPKRRGTNGWHRWNNAITGHGIIPPQRVSDWLQTGLWRDDLSNAKERKLIRVVDDGWRGVNLGDEEEE